MNITDSQWYVRDLKGKSEKHLRAYTSLFVSHLCEPGDHGSKAFEDGVPKEGININQVLARIGMVSLIRKKVHEYEKIHGLESIPSTKEPEEDNEMSKDFAEFEESSQNSAATDGKASVDNQSDKVEENVDKSSQEVKSEDKKEEETTENKTNNETEGGNDGDNAEVKPEGETEVQSEDSKVDGSDESKAETKEDDVEMKEEKSDQDRDKPEEKPEIKPEETNGISGEEPIVNGIKETVEEKVEEKPTTVEKFDFNIRDGGFTELQTLWYFEEQELKPGKEAEIWHRRHDYWLLAGIVKHGYERWKDIHEDEAFSILSEPFKSSIHIKNKFMERRLRLLEQALVFEEQFRRTAHLARLNLAEEKDKSEDMSEEGDEDKEEKEDKEEPEEKEETNDENKPLNATIHRCINQYEELMTDMKSDCGRIPQTVQRIPPIAQRLQISQKSFNQMGGQKRQFQM